MNVKRLAKNLRFGGMSLHRQSVSPDGPRPDGVRRANDRCVELDSYANFVQSGSASSIGILAIAAMAIMLCIFTLIGFDNLTYQGIARVASISLLLVPMSFLFYFASGAHRSRGAFIRIHRGTRKLYFVYPRKTRLHVLDWDQIEALAGYIPIVSASGYASRHPLYLIGVDHAMNPPTEICVACGNLGLFDGDRSAKALWAYLQAFMAHGLDGLPEPAPLPPRLTRKQEALQPYRDWLAGLRRRLAKPYGMLKAPITIPIWLGWLLINAFPDSVEAFIQYNVPYSKFPEEIEQLCGFDEVRTGHSR